MGTCRYTLGQVSPPSPETRSCSLEQPGACGKRGIHVCIENDCSAIRNERYLVGEKLSIPPSFVRINRARPVLAYDGPCVTFLIAGAWLTAIIHIFRSCRAYER